MRERETFWDKKNNGIGEINLTTTHLPFFGFFPFWRSPILRFLGHFPWVPGSDQRLGQGWRHYLILHSYIRFIHNEDCSRVQQNNVQRLKIFCNRPLSSSFNSIFLFGWRKNDKISLFPPSRLCFFLLWPQILFDWENDSWKIYVSQKFLTIICKRHRLFFLHSKKYWQGAALIRGMRLYGTFKPPRNLLSAFLPLVNYILLLASQLTLVNYVSWR